MTRTGGRRVLAAMAAAAVLATGCDGGKEGPSPDDLRYLAWEACRQLRNEGVTPERAAGILADVARHDSALEAVEAECGPEITAIFTPSSQP